MEESHDHVYTILVIGKAGTGKSSVCNTILGHDQFRTGCSLSSTTIRCEQAVTFKNNLRIMVVDTPDVTNCGMTREQMRQEVSRWSALVNPEPTAVLLTVRCDMRYTPEEHDVYRQLKSLLHDNFLNQHLVVVFTFGDQQVRDIRQELKAAGPDLQDVLKEAKNRYVVFYKTDNDRLKDQQRQQLIRVIHGIRHRTGNAVLPYVLAGSLAVSGFGCIVSLMANSSEGAIVCGAVSIALAIIFGLYVANKYFS